MREGEREIANVLTSFGASGVFEVQVFEQNMIKQKLILIYELNLDCGFYHDTRVVSIFCLLFSPNKHFSQRAGRHGLVDRAFDSED